MYESDGAHPPAPPGRRCGRPNTPLDIPTAHTIFQSGGLVKAREIAPDKDSGPTTVIWRVHPRPDTQDSLAMTRALGDFGYKASAALPAEEQMVGVGWVVVVDGRIIALSSQPSHKTRTKKSPPDQTPTQTNTPPSSQTKQTPKNQQTR